MLNSRKQLARQRLDKRLTSLQPAGQFSAPGKGWIRAIRDALGMSAMQLGKQLGVRQQSIADWEKSEVQQTIQLKTLRRAAEALDCTLVYALVPNSSLEHQVQQRARDLAREAISRVNHTMRLEAQGVSERDFEEHIEAYVRETLTERDLWEPS